MSESPEIEQIARVVRALDSAVLAPLEKYRVGFCISQIEHLEG